MPILTRRKGLIGLGAAIIVPKLARAEIILTPGGAGPSGAVATTTLNPATLIGPGPILSSGNLKFTTNAAGNNAALSIASHSTGKLYYEFQYLGTPTGNTGFGFCNSSQTSGDYIGGSSQNGLCCYGDGNVWINGASRGAWVSSPAINDWCGLAVDFGAQKVWAKDITKGSGWNNDIIANQNPSNGTGGISYAAFLNAGPYFAAAADLGSDVAGLLFNFGGSAYQQTVPTGFSNW